MSILIIYRPPPSEGNPYTGFIFLEDFGDFFGDRLKNDGMLVLSFNFHVDDVNDSENLAFYDLSGYFGVIQHVDCPKHQLRHTLDLIIAKEKHTFCISDVVDKFYISDNIFVHSSISISRP